MLEAVRDKLRANHYSLRTETAYIGWIRRFIRANRMRHPREMGGAEVEMFLTHLAVRGQVAASTQNQALSALLFLYRQVLRLDLPWMENVVRAKRPKRLPTVLSAGEVRALLELMPARPRLLAALLYGTGMRLMEGPWWPSPRGRTTARRPASGRDESRIWRTPVPGSPV